MSFRSFPGASALTAKLFGLLSTRSNQDLSVGEASIDVGHVEGAEGNADSSLENRAEFEDPEDVRHKSFRSGTNSVSTSPQSKVLSSSKEKENQTSFQRSKRAHHNPRPSHGLTLAISSIDPADSKLLKRFLKDAARHTKPQTHPATARFSHLALSHPLNGVDRAFFADHCKANVASSSPH